MKIIRTKQHGAYTQKSSTAWGKYFKRVDDPEGVSYDPAKKFKLPDPFPKLPNYLWRKVVKLYRDHVRPVHAMQQIDNNEVQVNFIRNMSDLNQWRVLVPMQQVSSTNVNSDMSQLVDLETGEEYDHFPPIGWAAAGTSHSHNTMGAFFSGTDDHSELHQPGMHIVVGRITPDTYEVIASIVLDGRRFKLPIYDVVDVEAGLPPVGEDGKARRCERTVRHVTCNDEGVTYTDKVKDYISLPAPVARTPWTRVVGKATAWSLDDFAVSGKGDERETSYEPHYEWEPFDHDEMEEDGKKWLADFATMVIKAMHHGDTTGNYTIDTLIEVMALCAWLADCIDAQHVRWLTDSNIDPNVALYQYPNLLGPAHDLHEKLWE